MLTGSAFWRFCFYPVTLRHGFQPVINDRDSFMWHFWSTQNRVSKWSQLGSGRTAGQGCRVGREDQHRWAEKAEARKTKGTKGPWKSKGARVSEIGMVFTYLAHSSGLNPWYHIKQVCRHMLWSQHAGDGSRTRNSRSSSGTQQVQDQLGVQNG